MTYDELVAQKEAEIWSKNPKSPIHFYEVTEENSREPIIFFDEKEEEERGRKELERSVHSRAEALARQEIENYHIEAVAVSECRSDVKNLAIAPQPNNLLSNIPRQRQLALNKPKNKESAYSIAGRYIFLNNIKVCGETIYLYTGTYYKKMTNTECMRSIMEFCRKEIEDVGTSKLLPDILNFIRLEPRLLYDPSDESSCYVSFINCVLDTERNIVYRHNPKYYVTYCIQCGYYEKRASAPAFEAFLSNITRGDAVLQERICQMIGYILTADTNAKVIFLLQGCSNSGKSVLSSLIRSFFNEEAVSDIDVHELCERFAASDLEGKALCLSPDLPSEPLDAKSVSKLKQFTGNDIISADVKYKDRTKFRCTAKFVLATNHPFLIRGTDEAFFKRIVVVPFNYPVPKNMQDYCLTERLKNERNVIASRAIEAYYRLKRSNYTFAGTYNINSAYSIYTNTDTNTDISGLVYTYMKRRYYADENAGEYLADIYNGFSEEYPEVTIQPNVFSKIFTEYAAQDFGAKKERKRKRGNDNPISYIAGIRRKSE